MRGSLNMYGFPALRALLLVMVLSIGAVVSAEPINAERAHFNYQLFCQGCHTPDGAGASSVPRMKGFVGTFLRSREGREFLVRVPGAATSALGNEELAEVLNWIVLEFSGNSLQGEFEPYSGDEVAALRQSPLNEIDSYRAQILTEIARK
jgi:hypothetical protein